MRRKIKSNKSRRGYRKSSDVDQFRFILGDPKQLEKQQEQPQEPLDGKLSDVRGRLVLNCPLTSLGRPKKTTEGEKNMSSHRSESEYLNVWFVAQSCDSSLCFSKSCLGLG